MRELLVAVLVACSAWYTDIAHCIQRQCLNAARICGARDNAFTECLDMCYWLSGVIIEHVGPPDSLSACSEAQGAVMLNRFEHLALDHAALNTLISSCLASIHYCSVH